MFEHYATLTWKDRLALAAYIIPALIVGNVVAVLLGII